MTAKSQLCQFKNRARDASDMHGGMGALSPDSRRSSWGWMRTRAVLPLSCGVGAEALTAVTWMAVWPSAECACACSHLCVCPWACFVWSQKSDFVSAYSLRVCELELYIGIILLIDA